MRTIKFLVGGMALVSSRLIASCMTEFYRRRLASCGEDVVMYPGVSIETPRTISIGSHTHLGERVHLRGGGKLVIGNWCQLANNVIIATGNHPINGERYYGNTEHKDITIGDNVWIASGAIILPGVTIGDNSVVAAGAVVTRSVPSNVIVAGVPARPVGTVPSKRAGGPGRARPHVTP